ncbi:type II toxin-antitoxin system MqsR family toxin [Vibrio parahaemolyticus]|uniref:type II toxin-antitoxin system MqsR family toxin n=1 Tax=Vibrio vulnificus TaxID=672 RepID=UPI00193D20F4|nr:type II toxin-antitoxin system MqsR family toxin [Vibrio parahaemolyticus]MBM5418822.1 type II toxin-antitoxin system MqsR family toxin [Vibrio parahaemolyticus]MCF9098471.1 type II toxin-antitoxin system MqsR family toxin [Vibrio parahaemolyticus]MCF9116531.1 type II toxin-antitoxin system MqsR family toxin [Vibrio parahaemolyticus]
MSTSFTTPTYNLSSLQQAFKSVNTLRMTGTARQGANALGMDDQDVVNAIQCLKPSDFYKTMPSAKMPTAANHDVYKFTWCGKEIYAKFQDLGGFIVVSFKEK